MTYFEPPPLPRSSSGPVDPQRSAAPQQSQEPLDPYASPPDGYRPGPAPAAPWGPPAQDLHPRGTTILVLGILSVTLMQVLGPFAWVMGHRTLRQIDASGRPYINRSSVQAGMILGIIGTVLGLIGLLWIALIVVAIVGSGTPG